MELMVSSVLIHFDRQGSSCIRIRMFEHIQLTCILCTAELCHAVRCCILQRAHPIYVVECGRQHVASSCTGILFATAYISWIDPAMLMQIITVIMMIAAHVTGGAGCWVAQFARVKDRMVIMPAA
jgi:hypothetical protein